MMKRLFYFIAIITAVTACSDDDSFSASRGNMLTFPADTLQLDTVFSNTPSSTYGFWVHNNSNDGIRIGNIRLEHGNQTGFRVNVDGVFLDNSNGSIAHDFEVRKGDSIRVFAELTSRSTGMTDPQKLTDNLIFTLESGIQQKVTLLSWSWDADVADSLIISTDTTLAPARPYVIRRGIRVAQGANLTIAGGTKMFFHDGAGIDVYGRMTIDGTAGNEVVMRGDRLDHIFSYLPYDRVSGQWRGIRFFETSANNRISFADIHSCADALTCDSAGFDATTPRLAVDHSTIHNCAGYGLLALNSNISISNTQISNTLGDCLAIYGGYCNVIYATLAQFYPFSADRGAALRFGNTYEGQSYPLIMLSCTNTIVTGYAADELMGEKDDGNPEETDFNYSFTNCLLRTPPISEDSEEFRFFTNVIFESAEDSIYGKLHFATIDEENLYYDFRLANDSPAKDKALPVSGITDDRLGNMRSQETPCIGAFEFLHYE